MELSGYGRRGLWIILLSLSLMFMFACRRESVETPVVTIAATVEPTVEATATPTATEVKSPTTEDLTPTAEPTLAPTPAVTVEPTRDAPAQFVEAPCAFDLPQGREVRCGYLEVPEDRADESNENTARLHVAIFASDSANPQPDPLIYLEGGPGGDALEGIPFIFEDRFAPFLSDRDLIMFDQRGTGYSEPSLDCPEYRELALEHLDDILDPEEEERLFLETMDSCRRRLIREGVTLDAYDSASSAADLDDLRRALGYEQWNLLGISYGTRLALTAMRDYPQGLRSVVLDSTYPPQVNIVTETPANLARAMEAFFAACAADQACDQAYPDLRSAFFDLLQQTNNQPIAVPVYHALNLQRYEAQVVGDDLLGVLFQGLYSEEIIPLLPQFIYDTREGDYEILSALLSNLIVSDEFLSIGMNFSVQCQEEIPFTMPADAQAAAEAHPELEAYFQTSATSGQTAFAICELWDVPAAPARENEIVRSDIPALILAGEYDPITPPAWGALVHENLPHSYFYEFPGLGHGVSLAGECPRDIVSAFLVQPEIEPDDSCIAQMKGAGFIIPGSAPPVVLSDFATNLFGIELRGVAPEGWEEVSTGVFARQQTVLDQTAILQQAAPGVSAEQFLSVLASQLGLEEMPALATMHESGGRNWALYRAEAQGAPVDIGLSEHEGITYVVLLFSNKEERDALYQSVFLPAIEAIEVDV